MRTVRLHGKWQRKELLVDQFVSPLKLFTQGLGFFSVPCRSPLANASVYSAVHAVSCNFRWCSDMPSWRPTCLHCWLHCSNCSSACVATFYEVLVAGWIWISLHIPSQVHTQGAMWAILLSWPNAWYLCLSGFWLLLPVAFDIGAAWKTAAGAFTWADLICP